MAGERATTAPSSSISRAPGRSAASRSFGSEIRTITPTRTSSVSSMPLIGAIPRGISSHIDRALPTTKSLNGFTVETKAQPKTPVTQLGTLSGKPEINPLAPAISQPVAERQPITALPTRGWTEIRAKPAVTITRIDIPSQTKQPVIATIGKNEQVKQEVARPNSENSAIWQKTFNTRLAAKKAIAEQKVTNRLVPRQAPFETLTLKAVEKPVVAITPPTAEVRALVHTFKQQLPDVIQPHAAQVGRTVPVEQMLGYFKSADALVQTYVVAGRPMAEARVHVAHQLATELQQTGISPAVEPVLEMLAQPKVQIQPLTQPRQKVNQLIDKLIGPSEGDTKSKPILVRDEKRNGRRKQVLVSALRSQIERVKQLISPRNLLIKGSSLIGELGKRPQPGTHKSEILEATRNDGGLHQLVGLVESESGTPEHMISVVEEGIAEHTAIRVSLPGSWERAATETQIAEVLSDSI